MSPHPAKAHSHFRSLLKQHSLPKVFSISTLTLCYKAELELSNCAIWFFTLSPHLELKWDVDEAESMPCLHSRVHWFIHEQYFFSCGKKSKKSTHIKFILNYFLVYFSSVNYIHCCTPDSETCSSSKLKLCIPTEQLSISASRQSPENTILLVSMSFNYGYLM